MQWTCPISVCQSPFQIRNSDLSPKAKRVYKIHIAAREEYRTFYRTMKYVICSKKDLGSNKQPRGWCIKFATRVKKVTIMNILFNFLTSMVTNK